MAGADTDKNMGLWKKYVDGERNEPDERQRLVLSEARYFSPLPISYVLGWVGPINVCEFGYFWAVLASWWHWSPILGRASVLARVPAKSSQTIICPRFKVSLPFSTQNPKAMQQQKALLLILMVFQFFSFFFFFWRGDLFKLLLLQHRLRLF